MTLLGSILLITSLVSLTVYSLALFRLFRQVRQRGLIRTACCRVVAALLYLMIAAATLSGYRNSGLVSIWVFVTIQLMWQANAVADVLLTRRKPKHLK